MDLTNEQRSDLRAGLLRALGKLQRSLKISEDLTAVVELDQQAVGRLSRMDALQNQGMSQRLEVRDRQRLQKLLDALDRLDRKAYGTCVNCERSIPYQRLLVFPETEICGRCG